VSARIISEHMSRTLGQQIARNACLQTPAPPAGTTGLLGRFGAAEIATSRETFCSCSGRLAILHRPGAGAVHTLGVFGVWVAWNIPGTAALLSIHAGKARILQEILK
jgi:hypothetical protein